MTPESFRALRDGLHLRQTDVARLLGVGERTVKTWEAIGGEGPTEPAARFLRYIRATGADPDAVMTILSFTDQ